MMMISSGLNVFCNHEVRNPRNVLFRTVKLGNSDQFQFVDIPRWACLHQVTQYPARNCTQSLGHNSQVSPKPKQSLSKLWRLRYKNILLNESTFSDVMFWLDDWVSNNQCTLLNSNKHKYKHQIIFLQPSFLLRFLNDDQQPCFWLIHIRIHIHYI